MNLSKALKPLLCAFVLAAAPAYARSGGHSYHHASHSHTSYYYHHSTSSHHRSTYVNGVRRDRQGHIARSSAAKHQFMKQTGYPHGRPGYVVDHIKPLKRGGADSPTNMQWQTKAAAKAKDKTE